MSATRCWRNLVRYMNEHGIPLPMIRVEGKASFSATLTFLAFNAWLVSVVGKAAGALGGMDTNATFQMFIACAGLYFGRKFQSDSKGEVTLESAESGKRQPRESSEG